MADEKQKCFVLMPFDTLRDKHYTQIYARAIDDAGMEPKRSDSLFRSSPIMADIWKFVQESAVLLADLTGRNANVFYELGLAHAISKPVVLVAETMDDVPFDLRGLRVLTFDRNDPDWGVALRERIASALKETISDVLGAVPSMFIRTTPHRLATTGESVLELQVRALAEEITALRRETTSSITQFPRAARATQLDAIAIRFANEGDRTSKEIVARAIKQLTGTPDVTFADNAEETFFNLAPPLLMANYEHIEILKADLQALLNRQKIAYTEMEFF